MHSFQIPTANIQIGRATYKTQLFAKRFECHMTRQDHAPTYRQPQTDMKCGRYKALCLSRVFSVHRLAARGVFLRRTPLCVDASAKMIAAIVEPWLAR